MKRIRIDIPDDVAWKLKAKASSKKKYLKDYLRDILEEDAKEVER